MEPLALQDALNFIKIPLPPPSLELSHLRNRKVENSDFPVRGFLCGKSLLQPLTITGLSLPQGGQGAQDRAFLMLLGTEELLPVGPAGVRAQAAMGRMRFSTTRWRHTEVVTERAAVRWGQSQKCCVTLNKSPHFSGSPLCSPSPL